MDHLFSSLTLLRQVSVERYSPIDPTSLEENDELLTYLKIEMNVISKCHSKEHQTCRIPKVINDPIIIQPHFALTIAHFSSSFVRFNMSSATANTDLEEKQNFVTKEINRNRLP